MNPLKRRRCLLYLNDIIIFSHNLDNQLRHVRDVMNVPRNAKITLKVKKCELFTDTVQSLGHVIRPGRVMIEKSLVKTLVVPKEPRS